MSLKANSSSAANSQHFTSFKTLLGTTAATRPVTGRFTRAPYQRSPDRQRSIKRRRTLAATAPLPPSMMAELTPSQQAYARILTDEIILNGQCDLSQDEIAARTGTCKTTAKNAQRRLAQLGWINVQERPNKGQKHNTNIITITSPDWATWTSFAKKRRWIGGKKVPATENTLKINTFITQLEKLRHAPKRDEQLSPELAASLGRLGAAIRAKDGPPDPHKR